MKELNNELEIHASAERVWQLLTDFAQFPQWNPFIQRASGELRAGAQLDVTLQPAGAHRTTIRPIVLTAERNRELRWRGHWLTPGLLDDEHVFTIEPLGTDRVRFTQREIFTGVLAPFRARRHNTDRRRDFRAMGLALKQRAEQPRSVD